MKPERGDETRALRAIRSSWALRITLVSLGALVGSLLAQSRSWQGWDSTVYVLFPPLFAGFSDPALWIRSPVWKRREALLTAVFAFGGELLSFFQTPWYYVIPPLTVGLLTGLAWAFRRWERSVRAKEPRSSTSIGFKLVAWSLLVFAAGAVGVALGFGLFTGLFVRGPLDVGYVTAGSLSLLVAIILVLASFGIFILGFSRLWKEREAGGAAFVRAITIARLLTLAGYALLFVLGLVGLFTFLFSRNVLVGPVLYRLTFVIFLVSVLPFLLAAVIPAVALSSAKARVRAWLATAVGFAGMGLAMGSALYASTIPTYPPWGPASVWVSSWILAAASALSLWSSYRSMSEAYGPGSSIT